MFRSSLIAIAVSVLALIALSAAVTQANPSVSPPLRQADPPGTPPPTMPPPPPTMAPPPSDTDRPGGPVESGLPRDQDGQGYQNGQRSEGGRGDQGRQDGPGCRAAAPPPPPTPVGQPGEGGPPAPPPPPPPPGCADGGQGTGTGSAGPVVREQSPTASFVLRSPDVQEGGDLPRQFTCDGESATLPLQWSGAPAQTQSYAVVMHHIPGPGDSHWYWVLYNLPPDVTSLPRNVTGIGTLGNNSVNGKLGYAPPCSKGPGPKVYTYTVYALSAAPQFSVEPFKVSRDVLLDAIQDRTLASAALNVTYTR